ncbi:MAG: hypothetical protein IJS97_08690 [Prevotella sp.]|nr:hypothetical protein [Prevotella sp.]
MKKVLTILAFMFMFVAEGFAIDYGFLTVQKQDGTEQSFVATGLKLTFSNGTMIAEQNGTTTTLALSELSKMFFTQTATSVERAKTVAEAGELSVYTIDGVAKGKVSNALDVQKMGRGVYIIKQGDKTAKIVVK